jgi:hypothetical protein
MPTVYPTSKFEKKTQKMAIAHGQCGPTLCVKVGATEKTPAQPNRLIFVAADRRRRLNLPSSLPFPHTQHTGGGTKEKKKGEAVGCNTGGGPAAATEAAFSLGFVKMCALGTKCGALRCTALVVVGAVWLAQILGVFSVVLLGWGTENFSNKNGWGAGAPGKFRKWGLRYSG